MEEDSSDVVTPEDSDSAVESDIRLRTTSQEVSNTRKGHSALVPGLSAPCNPNGVSKPFTTSGSKMNHYEDLKRPTEIDRSIPVQERGGRQVRSSIVFAETSERPPYGTTINGDSDDERHPLLSSDTKTDFWRILSKCWCKIVVPVILLGFLILIIVIGGLGSALTHPGTINNHLHINSKDTVLLDFFNTYYYEELEIHQASDNHCQGCKVYVYSLYPEDLIVDDNYYNVTSDQLTASHDGVLLPPNYYISGSTINLSVTFHPTKGQNTTVDFLVYNNLKFYESFQRGDKPTPLQVYPFQLSENETTFSLLLKILDTGYYYIGIRPTSSPVTFQSSLVVHQINYSRDNFPAPACSLDSETTVQCTIHFTVSLTDSPTDNLKTCVLVYFEPPQAIQQSYYMSLEYNVYRGFWTVASIVLLSLIILLTSCVCGLSCYWFCCCVYYVRTRSRFYY